MDIKVYPGRLSGTIEAPPSKSIAHRVILCGMLSGGPCNISNLELSEDIQATLNGTKAIFSDGLTVECGDSASTLRFLLPVLAILGRKATFTGGARLATRTLEPVLTLLKDHGVRFTTGGETGWFPLTIDGKVRGDIFAIRGDISSQILSGLLLAMPLIGRDSEIVLTTPLASKDYITLTIDVMRQFGVKVKYTGLGWMVPGRQEYAPTDYQIEGDYSSAAYFLCTNQFPRGNVRVTGLSPSSKQADKAIIDILPALGNGLQVDVKDIPDSIPILAIMAAFAEGQTTFFNAGRLRMKELDRLSAISDGVCKLGGNAEVFDDILMVYGGRRMTGGVTISAFGDHRIAMALSIGALGCEKPTIITGVESVIKAYPNFYKDFKALGGNMDVVTQSE